MFLHKTTLFLLVGVIIKSVLEIDYKNYLWISSLNKKNNKNDKIKFLPIFVRYSISTNVIKMIILQIEKINENLYVYLIFLL